MKSLLTYIGQHQSQCRYWIWIFAKWSKCFLLQTSSRYVWGTWPLEEGTAIFLWLEIQWVSHCENLFTFVAKEERDLRKLWVEKPGVVSFMLTLPLTFILNTRILIRKESKAPINHMYIQFQPKPRC